MITVLAGGVGAARFLRGLVEVVTPSDITAIVNVADDFELHGLHISPDLDTVRYTLADDVGEQGWGRSSESWTAMDELESLGRHAPAGSRATEWFRLGDRDLATNLYRTQRLQEGASLSQVTSELCSASGVTSRLLPATDDHVFTTLTLATSEVVDFQEYFVARRHGVAVRDVQFTGVQEAKPASGVLDAIEHAERIVIAPSNPILSIAPILAIAGIADAVRARRDRVIAISPIVAGHALKGPADHLLTELGHESTVTGIARIWAPVAATLVVDMSDSDSVSSIEAEGMRASATGTVMTDTAAAAALADDVLHLPLS